MPTDRPYPIFVTPEILEHILQYLTVDDLLASAQRVSHFWKSLIATSPTIQKAVVDHLIANRLQVGNERYENGSARQFLYLKDFTNLVEPRLEAWLHPRASWRHLLFAKGRDVFMLARTTEGQPPAGLRSLYRWIFGREGAKWAIVQNCTVLYSIRTGWSFDFESLWVSVKRYGRYPWGYLPAPQLRTTRCNPSTLLSFQSQATRQKIPPRYPQGYLP